MSACVLFCIGPGLYSDEQGVEGNQLLRQTDLEPVGGSRRCLPDLLLVGR